MLFSKASKQKESLLEMEKKFLTDFIIKYSFSFPSFPLSNSIVLEGENGQKESLKSVVGESQITILKISQNNCFSCIESEFNVLKNLKGNRSNIIIIAQYDSIRELALLKNKNNLEYKIFNTVDQLPMDKLEKLNVPYYFTVNETLNMSSFFIPDKNYPFLSENYLINRAYN
ncbi:hypothetical protein [Pseudopedobacter saltans]|nr:hypothetical protein [Pseudopedobacter saltans]